MHSTEGVLRNRETLHPFGRKRGLHGREFASALPQTAEEYMQQAGLYAGNAALSSHGQQSTETVCMTNSDMAAPWPDAVRRDQVSACVQGQNGPTTTMTAFRRPLPVGQRKKSTPSDVVLTPAGVAKPPEQTKLRNQNDSCAPTAGSGADSEGTLRLTEPREIGDDRLHNPPSKRPRVLSSHPTDVDINNNSHAATPHAPEVTSPRDLATHDEGGRSDGNDRRCSTNVAAKSRARVVTVGKGTEGDSLTISLNFQNDKRRKLDASKRSKQSGACEKSRGRALSEKKIGWPFSVNKDLNDCRNIFDFFSNLTFDAGDCAVNTNIFDPELPGIESMHSSPPFRSNPLSVRQNSTRMVPRKHTRSKDDSAGSSRAKSAASTPGDDEISNSGVLTAAATGDKVPPEIESDEPTSKGPALVSKLSLPRKQVLHSNTSDVAAFEKFTSAAPLMTSRENKSSTHSTELVNPEINSAALTAAANTLPQSNQEENAQKSNDNLCLVAPKSLPPKKRIPDNRAADGDACDRITPTEPLMLSQEAPSSTDLSEFVNPKINSLETEVRKTLPLSGQQELAQKPNDDVSLLALLSQNNASPSSEEDPLCKDTICEDSNACLEYLRNQVEMFVQSLRQENESCLRLVLHEHSYSNQSLNNKADHVKTSHQDISCTVSSQENLHKDNCAGRREGIEVGVETYLMHDEKLNPDDDVVCEVEHACNDDHVQDEPTAEEKEIASSPQKHGPEELGDVTQEVVNPSDDCGCTENRLNPGETEPIQQGFNEEHPQNDSVRQQGNLSNEDNLVHHAHVQESTDGANHVHAEDKASDTSTNPVSLNNLPTEPHANERGSCDEATDENETDEALLQQYCTGLLPLKDPSDLRITQLPRYRGRLPSISSDDEINDNHRSLADSATRDYSDADDDDDIVFISFMQPNVSEMLRETNLCTDQMFKFERRRHKVTKASSSRVPHKRKRFLDDIRLPFALRTLESIVDVDKLTTMAREIDIAREAPARETVEPLLLRRNPEAIRSDSVACRKANKTKNKEKWRVKTHKKKRTSHQVPPAEPRNATGNQIRQKIRTSQDTVHKGSCNTESSRVDNEATCGSQSADVRTNEEISTTIEDKEPDCASSSTRNSPTNNTTRPPTRTIVAKVEGEQEYVPDEQEKVSDEQEKVPHEQEKVSHEQEKAPDEQEKVSDEQDRLPDEQEKVPHEQEKVLDETTKVLDEHEKLPDEQKKVPHEQENVPHEQEKFPAEQEKVLDETTKVLDEHEKLPDEQEKVPHEQEKVPHEQEKVPHQQEKLSDGQEKVMDGQENVPFVQIKASREREIPPTQQDKLPDPQEKVQDGQEQLPFVQIKASREREKSPTQQDKLPDPQEKVQDGQEQLPFVQIKASREQEIPPTQQDKLPDPQEKVQDGQEKLPFVQGKVSSQLEKLSEEQEKVSDELEKAVSDLLLIMREDTTRQHRRPSSTDACDVAGRQNHVTANNPATITNQGHAVEKQSKHVARIHDLVTSNKYFATNNRNHEIDNRDKPIVHPGRVENHEHERIMNVAHEDAITKRDHVITNHEDTINKQHHATTNHENAISKQANAITNHDATIDHDYVTMIRNQDPALSKQNRAIANHENVIDKQVHVVTSRDHVISSQDRVIASQDPVTARQNHELTKQDHVIGNPQAATGEIKYLEVSSRRNSTHVTVAGNTRALNALTGGEGNSPTLSDATTEGNPPTSTAALLVAADPRTFNRATGEGNPPTSKRASSEGNPPTLTHATTTIPTSGPQLPTAHSDPAAAGSSSSGEKIARFVGRSESQYFHGMLETELSVPSKLLAHRPSGLAGRYPTAIVRRRIPYVQIQLSCANPTLPDDRRKPQRVDLTLVRLRDIVFALRCAPERVRRDAEALGVVTYPQIAYSRHVYASLYHVIATTDSHIAPLMNFRDGDQSYLERVIHLSDFLGRIVPKFYAETFQVIPTDVPKYVHVKAYQPVNYLAPELAEVFKKSYAYNSILILDDIDINDQTPRRKTTEKKKRAGKRPSTLAQPKLKHSRRSVEQQQLQAVTQTLTAQLPTVPATVLPQCQAVAQISHTPIATVQRSKPRTVVVPQNSPLDLSSRQSSAPQLSRHDPRSAGARAAVQLAADPCTTVPADSQRVSTLNLISTPDGTFTPSFHSQAATSSFHNPPAPRVTFTPSFHDLAQSAQASSHQHAIPPAASAHRQLSPPDQRQMPPRLPTQPRPHTSFTQSGGNFATSPLRTALLSKNSLRGSSPLLPTPAKTSSKNTPASSAPKRPQQQQPPPSPHQQHERRQRFGDQNPDPSPHQQQPFVRPNYHRHPATQHYAQQHYAQQHYAAQHYAGKQQQPQIRQQQSTYLQQYKAFAQHAFPTLPPTNRSHNGKKQSAATTNLNPHPLPYSNFPALYQGHPATIGNDARFASSQNPKPAQYRTRVNVIDQRMMQGGDAAGGQSNKPFVQIGVNTSRDRFTNSSLASQFDAPRANNRTMPGSYLRP